MCFSHLHSCLVRYECTEYATIEIYALLLINLTPMVQLKLDIVDPYAHASWNSPFSIVFFVMTQFHLSVHVFKLCKI